MEKTNEIQQLLNSAISELYKAEKFSESYMSKALKVGLQAEKRRMEIESVKFHELINYLIKDSYDLFKIDLSRKHEEQSIPTINSIDDWFIKSKEYFENLYFSLHKISNSLVLSCASIYSSKIQNICHCLADMIKYYNRSIDELKINPVIVLLRQTTDENLHDKFEAKSKKIEMPN